MNNKGISLISLIISIIVIIILAAIVIFTGLGTPDKAKFAQLASDLSGLQEVVQQKFGEKYADFSTKNLYFNDSDIYRWIATGDSITTTSGWNVIIPSVGSSLYGATLPNEDRDGNDLMWGVKVVSPNEKKIIEIDEENNKLGVKLPRYEGRIFLMRLSDGLVMIDPPYEYDGKQYVSIEDINNGGGTYVEADTSSPNSPVIKAGMVPVYYDESEKCWKKADTSNYGNSWYNYSEKKWANMVTVSNNRYYSANIGTKILEEDILGYWVWIPRFAYTLNPESQTTNVVFLEGTSNMFGNKVAGENNEYIIHPAFRKNPSDGDIGGWIEELSGIWVAKFEASNSEVKLVDDYTGYSVATINGESNPVIVSGNGKISDAEAITNKGYNKTKIGYAKFIPNVTSWRNIDLNEIFNKSLDVKNMHNISTSETHLMKNTEWGAVAYLSKSQYGLGSTDILPNSYYEGEGQFTSQTGMCGSDVKDYCKNGWIKTSKTYGTDGTIIIEYKDATTGESVANKVFYSYDTVHGRAASTTGNIYGVYDMSGGSNEYTASILNANNEILNTLSNKGMSYDKAHIMLYPMGTTNDAADNRNSNNYYGDGTTEIFNTLNKNWYQDRASFPSGSSLYFARGADFASAESCGVFAFNSFFGFGNAYNYNISFRVVLIP